MVFERIFLITRAREREGASGVRGEEKDQEEGENIELSVGISGELTASEYCFVFIHGAGSSKYSWHQQLSQFSKYFLCLAPDLRGHGDSSPCSSLALPLLVQDLQMVMEGLRGVIGTRSLIFICHSVGGAIGTNYALQSLSKNTSGGDGGGGGGEGGGDHIPIRAVLVLDLVEGTALDSLPHMKLALGAWPSHFHEINQGIEFSTQQCRPQSHYSAHISVPPLLHRDDSQGGVYLWKTPLLKYEDDWRGWFEGFNENFLSLPCPHCLIIANIERLDGQMSAAQMQGRFELFVTHGGNGGHFIQEDNPGELLGIIVRFLSNRGIISGDIATSLLTSGLHSVAVGNIGLMTPHIPMRGGIGGSQQYRSPFPKNS